MTCRLLRGRLGATAAALWALAGGGCGGPGPDDAAALAEARAAAEETDGWIAEELAGPAFAQAEGWLDQEGHLLFEGDPQAVRGLVRDLYAEGADAVFFVSIEELGGARVSAALAAELPRSPALRAGLLRREAAFWGMPGPRPDVGQRYLAFTFD